MQEFYSIYHKSHNVYADYKEQVTEWEKIYSEDSQRRDKKSVLERLKNPPKKTTDYRQQMVKNNGRGAR